MMVVDIDVGGGHHGWAGWTIRGWETLLSGEGMLAPARRRRAVDNGCRHGVAAGAATGGRRGWATADEEDLDDPLDGRYGGDAGTPDEGAPDAVLVAALAAVATRPVTGGVCTTISFMPAFRRQWRPRQRRPLNAGLAQMWLWRVRGRVAAGRGAARRPFSWPPPLC